MLCAHEDDPNLDIHDIPSFFQHVLSRIDLRRDLHFQTRTTMDTLDYSGHGLNQGSKLVMAAVGKPIRELPTQVPSNLTLPSGFDDARVCMPGVLAIRGPSYAAGDDGEGGAIRRLCAALGPGHSINVFPLVVVVDDAEFAARTQNNFLWVAFTRANPAVDIDGIGAFTLHKHWGCTGALVLDARRKPHHAPPLIEDPKVTAKVDALAQRGGPLHGIL